MLQPKSRSVQPTVEPFRSAGRLDLPRAQPFFGAMDAVIVDNHGEFTFDGAIRHAEAEGVWRWLARDVAPDLIDIGAGDADAQAVALETNASALVTRVRALLAASTGAEAERRLRIQLGSNELWQRLPAVLDALRCLPLLSKARAFGRAINGLPDDDALVVALQSMPRQDARAAALLMMAAVGEVIAPERLTVPATRIAGGTSETALQRAGFGPLIDAILAHAQNTIPPLLQGGTFADVELACRAVERFHRLIRSISAYAELMPKGRWSITIAALTKAVSDRLEPKLREVTPAINRSLRKMRDGAPDRLDSDGLLVALSGLYLLAAVRDSRDSLALNEVFDETWLRSGQALELHLTRNLDALRASPADSIVAARVDSGIKMADIRFGAEYADVLRRARDGVERRLSG